MRGFAIFCVAVLVSLLTVGGAGAVDPRPAPAGRPAATLDGATISEAEVEQEGLARLVQLYQQEYAIRLQILDDKINKLLAEREAKARGVAPEDLIKAEVDDKTVPPTSEEIRAFYEANKARVANVPEAEALQKVTDHLKAKKRGERSKAFYSELRQRAHVRVLLDPPRIGVDPDDDPAMGLPTAPVTIIAFVDFECPHCAKLVTALDQVATAYKEKVRIVYRDFPLEKLHKRAIPAAEAATCAGKQGKYWEMFDRLFGDPSKLEAADIVAHATAIGLDQDAFGKCLTAGPATAEWQKDMADGTRYGVSMTPTSFVNGRMILGSKPFEGLAEIVDDELARAKPDAAAAAAAGTAPSPVR